MTIKLLIVEDSEQDLVVCRSSVKRYQKEKNRQIEIVECKTLEDALQKRDNSFDGAIIDLKLGIEGNEGNQVVNDIRTSFRIPIIILTGTPENANVEGKHINVFKKGEIEYVDIFDDFFYIFDTGLTKILGGRGEIEQIMHRVFWEHLLPHLDGWKIHVQNKKNTEKSLLRFTINHLLELLDDELENCLPEEMYICPPVSQQIRTGSIVKASSTDEYYIVLSPACDLALHDGKIKTNRILVCAIEKRNFSLIKDARKNLQKPEKQDSAERILTQLPRNTYSNYYHYLPRTSTFNGGVIDFRKVSTHSPKDFTKEFDAPSIQISMAFTKDIVSRFSSYYARQGQPDFESDALVEDLKKE